MVEFQRSVLAKADAAAAHDPLPGDSAALQQQRQVAPQRPADVPPVEEGRQVREPHAATLRVVAEVESADAELVEQRADNRPLHALHDADTRETGLSETQRHGILAALALAVRKEVLPR